MSIVADVTSDNMVGTSQLASMTNLMMSEAEERCDIGMTVLQHFGCPRPRVVYRGVTGSFFGIGILPVSDLLDFRYFGRYY